MIPTPERYLYRIAFYDTKKRVILKTGSSRPCGNHHNRTSIHAEECAINYCRNIKKKNLHIYIWRWGSNGEIKPAMCCYRCTKVLNKYNMTNNVFTFNLNKNIISAISENPEISLAYKIKNGL